MYLGEVWGYLILSNEFSGISFGYFVEGKATQIMTGMVYRSWFLKPFMSL